MKNARIQVNLIPVYVIADETFQVCPAMMYERVTNTGTEAKALPHYVLCISSFLGQCNLNFLIPVQVSYAYLALEV